MRGRAAPADPETCPHPPARRYVNAGEDALGEFFIVSCCACGKTLADLAKSPKWKRRSAHRAPGRKG